MSRVIIVSCVGVTDADTAAQSKSNPTPRMTNDYWGYALKTYGSILAYLCVCILIMVVAIHLYT